MSRLYIPPDLADSTTPNPAEAATPAGPSNLRLRITYGLIGAALLLGSVWFSPVTFGLFFAAVQAVMLWEFYRMMRAGGYAPATWIGVGAGLVLFSLAAYSFLSGAITTTYGNLTRITQPPAIDPAWMQVSWAWGMLIVVLPVAFLLREMVIWPRYKQPFVNAATGLLGILYVSIPMALLNVISMANNRGYDYRRIFALLFLIWASDIGAYAAGKTFGKHKMAPKISPGKTWEGWAGGFVLTLVVGWAVGFMLPDVPLAHRLVAAGVVAVFAPLGDLAESMLKRSVGVKDSGSIMPGHGGLLDRFDAFLLVLPVLALLQLLAG